MLSTLAQAGVSTGSAVGGGTLNQDAIAGKLTLDAGKLTSALTDHFSDVKALFTNITGSYSSEGLSQRLDSTLTGWLSPTSGILTGRINSEQTTIDSLTTQISDWDTRLTAKEAALRAQFTAMETALSQLQSQSGQLTSSIGALSGGSK
jgi:flagellar hook-associated protein 2